MGNVLLTKALDVPSLGTLIVGLEVLIAILVIALIVLISKITKNGVVAAASAPAAAPASPIAPAAPVASAPAAAPAAAAAPAFKTNLHNVSDRDAAMIMAIVADEMQAPLNELGFISIKEVE